MDRLGGDGDFLAALADQQALWREACDVGKRLSQNMLPGASSPAMEELSYEAKFKNLHWREPVQAAHSVIQLGLLAVNDHLQNYARLFESEPVPTFSHLVIARAAIETAGYVNWLAEPGGAKKRVQRYEVHRLSNANSMDVAPAPQIVREKACQVRENVKRGAAELNWGYHSGKRKNSAKVGGEEEARAREMIEAVLAPPSVTSKLGNMLWWYLSGVAHGKTHALMQSVEAMNANSSSIEEQLATVYAKSSSVMIVGHATLEAYVRVTERVAKLFGWTSTEWDCVVAKAAAMGKQTAAAVAAERPATSGNM